VDLTAWLLRHTPPRPLVVAVPGGTEARLAVERVVRERGWRFATSPAEANVLVVAGSVTSGIEPYAERVWEQLPAPRARVDLHSAATTENQLDAAMAELRDVEHQRQQATRPGHSDHQPEPAHEHTEEHGHDAHSVTEHTEHGHDMPTHDGHEHNAHHDMHHGGGHDMHGHDMGGMAMPGNVPMADRAEDRDGLMLDQLHVPLGPVLPDWPVGLIVRTTLQGDVIQHATVEVLGGGGPQPPWPEQARTLDSCARLLSVAGWVDASVTARRLRDTALNGAMDTGLFARWARRVRRSRTLRWLLEGAGTTPDDASTPPELRGDALARLHRWLETPSTPASANRTQWTLDNLPALLEGSELATARLIVASLDPDLDVLAHQEVGHG
jgi:hypothetical protein